MTWVRAGVEMVKKYASDLPLPGGVEQYFETLRLLRQMRDKPLPACRGQGNRTLAGGSCSCPQATRHDRPPTTC